MDSSSRVVVNTIAQYIKNFISIVLTLYTSRLILYNLGIDDYGIYMLVSGVIYILGFVQNSLSRTIQRYLSFYRGKGDAKKVVEVFNNSVCVQFIIALVLCAALILLSTPIFSHFIHVPDEKLQATKIVYYVMTIGLFFNFIGTPYLASLISHENIVYSSVVQIIDALLKLPIALSLSLMTTHRLEFFSILSVFLIIINFLLYFIYCRCKYDETKHFSFHSFKKNVFKDMFSFMGWSIVGTMSIVGRNQGLAIVLNQFFSTAINAAYGIANQVAGQITFFSNALITAFNPQIIQSKGAGESERFVRLTEISCKFSYIVMSMVAIPAIVYMPTLLSLWLVEVPERTVIFCDAILISILIDLITQNIGSAVQAIGDIKLYTILFQGLKLLTLPLAYFALLLYDNVILVMAIYVLIEFVCTFGRLAYLYYDMKWSVSHFIHTVIYPVIIPTLINSIVCYFLGYILTGWSFLITGIVSVALSALMYFYWGLEADEKSIIESFVVRNMPKFIKQ